MIVIICAKYKKNPFRTVDATERTRFSKSRPNDLEDIGQGQGSSHATHPLMLLIICTKYGKNPSWTVDATFISQFYFLISDKVHAWVQCGHDRQTGWIQYTPLTSLRGYNYGQELNSNNYHLVLNYELSIFQYEVWIKFTINFSCVRNKKGVVNLYILQERSGIMPRPVFIVYLHYGYYDQHNYQDHQVYSLLPVWWPGVSESQFLLCLLWFLNITS